MLVIMMTRAMQTSKKLGATNLIAIGPLVIVMNQRSNAEHVVIGANAKNANLANC